MAPKRQTTVEERKIVVKLHNETKKIREIADIVGIPKSTVYNIIERYGKERSFVNKPKSGRPSKLSKYDERKVLRIIKKCPKTSAPEIAQELANTCAVTVCPQTVRNTIKKNGFNSRVARKKFFVSKINKIKRYNFAKSYVSKPAAFWENWIFTDESKYNISGSDGRRRVWREKNRALDPKNMTGTVKHGGGSVMVWGCMSANGVGNLHFINGIMNQYIYIDLLKNNLLQSAEKMGLSGNFVFQQDNDPKHSSVNAKLWILYNTPKYEKTPPQSPDLNPIEHLWEELDRRIRARSISNITDLRKALAEEWVNITPNVTKNLVDSMPKRLRAVMESKGYPTKY